MQKCEYNTPNIILSHTDSQPHSHTHTSHLSEWNTITNTKIECKNHSRYFSLLFSALSLPLSLSLLLYCVYAYNTFWIKHNNNNAQSRVRVIILNGAAASASLTFVVVLDVFGTANCWPSPLPTQCGHLVTIFLSIPIPLWPPLTKALHRSLPLSCRFATCQEQQHKQQLKQAQQRQRSANCSGMQRCMQNVQWANRKDIWVVNRSTWSVPYSQM